MSDEKKNKAALCLDSFIREFDNVLSFEEIFELRNFTENSFKVTFPQIKDLTLNLHYELDEEMDEWQFKKIEFEDRELIHSYFLKFPSRSCERTFGNTFLWSRYYPVAFAIIENTLVFHAEYDKGSFSYPAGAPQDVKKAISILKTYTETQGIALKFYHVTPEQFAQMNQWLPDVFETG